MKHQEGRSMESYKGEKKKGQLQILSEAQCASNSQKFGLGHKSQHWNPKGSLNGSAASQAEEVRN